MLKQQLLCVISLILAIGCVPQVVAVEPRTAHTFRLSADEAHPQATLDNARWLVGSWSGTAFGKRFEEVWSAPSAGSMLSTFKLFNGNTPEFYEIQLLTVEAGTLSLKVKHFSPDFSAWEDKSDYVEFRLVKMSENELHFSGISFYRLDADHMEAYVVMRNGDELMEHKLVYERVNFY